MKLSNIISHHTLVDIEKKTLPYHSNQWCSCLWLLNKNAWNSRKIWWHFLDLNFFSPLNFAYKKMCFFVVFSDNKIKTPFLDLNWQARNIENEWLWVWWHLTHSENQHMCDWRLARDYCVDACYNFFSQKNIAIQFIIDSVYEYVDDLFLLKTLFENIMKRIIICLANQYYLGCQ